MTNKTQDIIWLRVAFEKSELSKAKRLKVGTVILCKDPSCGYVYYGSCNHMPSFMNQDECEDIINPDPKYLGKVINHLVTKPELIHAEEDVIIKAGNKCKGATLYVTDSPCIHCAKLIWNAGIKRVVYCRSYRLTDGIDFLTKAGIEVVQIPIEKLGL